MYIYIHVYICIYPYMYVYTCIYAYMIILHAGINVYLVFDLMNDRSCD